MDYTRKASIQRKTLWQQIADVLREDIIRGKIKPGERIVEEDIAEKFHVSRGPVREALRHIGEEGFVVYESHKGSTVKTISYEEMQEKYLVRSTLEVLAIRIIAGRAETECSGNVTKENIATILDTGVDYVSSGALTHSAPILDVSLKNLHPIE